MYRILYRGGVIKDVFEKGRRSYEREHKTKKALRGSLLALFLCIVLLIGTTFAWFTDTASTGVNKIQAGNLKVGLQYKTANSEDWQTVTENTDDIFAKDALWEPGHVEYVNLKVENLGTLALKYQLGVNVFSETSAINSAGQEFYLSNYLKAAVVDGAQKFASRQDAINAVADGTSLENYVKESTLNPNANEAITLIVYMPETVGNEANYKTGTDAPVIELGVNLAATQTPYESDSFGTDYDKNAEYDIQVVGTNKLNKLFKDVEENGTVTLDKNLAFKPADGEAGHLAVQSVIDKAMTLDLSGKTMAFNKDKDSYTGVPAMIAVTAGKEKTVTIDGDGVVNCELGNNTAYGVNITNGSNVIVKSGTFYGAMTAIQVQKGSLTIEGGFFDMAPTCKAAFPQYAKYIVNVIDSAYKNGTASISITGGTFVNFDPSANPEGAGTSYVAAGYKVVEEKHGSDTWYKVVKNNQTH